MNDSVKTLTLKEYLQKIMQHKIRVTPIMNAGAAVTWLATKRNDGTSAEARCPIDAVSILSNQLESQYGS